MAAPGSLLPAGLGLTIGRAAFGASLSGSLGLGLIALAALACPVSMGLMMWRRTNRNALSGSASIMADCCAPGAASTAAEADSSAERLAALRAKREALERELAELQIR